MEAILGILATLKVDNTLWVQLGVFLFAYLVMSQLVFKPYLDAYQKRQDKTVGGEEQAEKLAQDALVIQNSYEEKLREVNAEFKSIYDKEKSEAQKVYNEKVGLARTEADSIIDATRKEIETNVAAVKQELKNEIPAISAAMTAKLIGKEASQ